MFPEALDCSHDDADTEDTSSDYTCKLCRDRRHVAARYPAAKTVKRRTKGHAAFTTVANTCMGHAGRMRANDACSFELLPSTSTLLFLH